jgi:hypothetical protein
MMTLLLAPRKARGFSEVKPPLTLAVEHGRSKGIVVKLLNSPGVESSSVRRSAAGGIAVADPSAFGIPSAASGIPPAPFGIP